MNLLDMLRPNIGAMKSGFTVRAAKWSLTCVGSVVPNKMLVSRKGTPADVALRHH